MEIEQLEKKINSVSDTVNHIGDSLQVFSSTLSGVSKNITSIEHHAERIGENSRDIRELRTQVNEIAKDIQSQCTTATDIMRIEDEKIYTEISKSEEKQDDKLKVAIRNGYGQFIFGVSLIPIVFGYVYTDISSFKTETKENHNKVIERLDKLINIMSETTKETAVTKARLEAIEIKRNK